MTTMLTVRHGLTLAALLGAASAPAFSQDDSSTDLRRQIEILRAEQARIAELQRQTDARLRQLEAVLEAAPSASGPAVAAAEPAIEAPAATVLADADSGSRLRVSGDFRLRAQSDHDRDVDQLSGQIRGRLGATYAINDRLTIGGRLATGDSRNPRSTDVQLSNWNDDLEVSLDMAYAQIDLGNLQLYGGKFPQPFVRTDLVWDGDVNPQGVAATYRLPLSGGAAFRANALFYPVDITAGDSDSTMAGVQFGYDSPRFGGFGYAVSGGYYDYSLGPPDARHLRSNRVTASGAYLSDYRLFNATAILDWEGTSASWPLRFVADYVRNLGAIDDEDTGYELTASVGRTTPGNWRFSYSFGQTDVDAVLAAFSHDNIPLATNYRLHTLAVDYGVTRNTSIGGIWYRFRADNPLHAGADDPSGWIDRLRLFYLFTF